MLSLSTIALFILVTVAFTHEQARTNRAFHIFAQVDDALIVVKKLQSGMDSWHKSDDADNKDKNAKQLKMVKDGLHELHNSLYELHDEVEFQITLATNYVIDFGQEGPEKVAGAWPSDLPKGYGRHWERVMHQQRRGVIQTHGAVVGTDGSDDKEHESLSMGTGPGLTPTPADTGASGLHRRDETDAAADGEDSNTVPGPQRKPPKLPWLPKLPIPLPIPLPTDLPKLPLPKLPLPKLPDLPKLPFPKLPDLPEVPFPKLPDLPLPTEILPIPPTGTGPRIPHKTLPTSPGLKLPGFLRLPQTLIALIKRVVSRMINNAVLPTPIRNVLRVILTLLETIFPGTGSTGPPLSLPLPSPPRPTRGPGGRPPQARGREDGDVIEVVPTTIVTVVRRDDGSVRDSYSGYQSSPDAEWQVEDLQEEEDDDDDVEVARRRRPLTGQQRAELLEMTFFEIKAEVERERQALNAAGEPGDELLADSLAVPRLMAVFKFALKHAEKWMSQPENREPDFDEAEEEDVSDWLD